MSSARGIGDAVSGLYAACGLASAMREPVTYHCHHPAWLAGVSHPWLSVVPDTGPADWATDMSDDYGGELDAAHRKTCPSRVQWYCDRLAKKLNVSAFAGRRPAAVVRPEPAADPGYVLLAPFSAQRQREWPASGWAELARDLTGGGRRVVAVGPVAKQQTMGRLFGRLPVEIQAGRPVAELLGLIAHADRVYGNDSGLVHVAGLYGVPAVAVMTHLSADFVFGDTAPSVRGVGADPATWPCQGCGWRGTNFRATCRHGCGALLSISADRVRQRSYN
jgi:hypothetical protein